MPTLAGDDDQTLRDAATVLRAIIDDNIVPPSLWAQVRCVMVLPDVRRFGFGIGGGGRGPMSCRTGKNFLGAWSAPVMYKVDGVRLNGSSSEYVLLMKDGSGVANLLMGSTQLGLEARAEPGPSGVSAPNRTAGDILTYGRAKGLFTGVSMGSATLEPASAANKRLYGGDIGPPDILTTKAVTTPAAGREFISTLDNKFAMRGP